MKRRTLVVVAVLLGGVLAFTGVVSARHVGRQLAVGRTCSAVAEGRFGAALAESSGLAGVDDEGRVATECRCRALEASGRADECAALLGGLLDEPGAASWLPPSDLAARVVRARLEAGDPEAAAELARRVAAVNPADAAIHQLEIVTRSALEGETVVLEDLERRLAASSGSSLGLRLALAVSYSRRNDPGRVVAALGEVPPPRGHPFTTFWFQARCWAIAQLGDLPRLRETYDTWRAQGGDPHAIEADYALQLSVAQLRDPERSWVELIAGALEHESELRDPKVPAALYVRWIGHLLVAGEFGEALELHDRAAARYELVGITREQIVQGRMVADLGAEAAAVGELVFRLPDGAPAGALWLSPDVGAEPDAAFVAYPLAAGGEVRVRRGLGATPQRWVFRDAEDRTVASGSVWPVAAGEATVRIEVSPGVAPHAFAPSPPDPDGRRRVFVILPDCGDWRLVQYLRTRGELPVMDALLAQGHRAVLTSDPPLTAAAMEKLVWPERGRDVSFLGELNRLGLELAGLASVGRNPLGFLAAVLPEGQSVFETVGEGPRVAANLLFSHGGIDAGRHARLHGPRGADRETQALEAWRELTPREAAEWTGARSDRAREHARTIAAEMDAALEIARAGEVDLLMLRVEPLDLLTHELFGELTRTFQDDGRSGLLDAYRYLDRRIGELWNALDGDDILVVLSDHGARTAMEHSTDALFVAVGAGIAPGRAPGRPEIAGVPRALAALFELETQWPETGVAASWERAAGKASVSLEPGLSAETAAAGPEGP